MSDDANLPDANLPDAHGGDPADPIDPLDLQALRWALRLAEDERIPSFERIEALRTYLRIRDVVEWQRVMRLAAAAVRLSGGAENAALLAHAIRDACGHRRPEAN